MGIDLGNARKILSESFVSNADSMGADELRKVAVTAEQRIKDLEDEQEADEHLAAAKKVAKDLNSAYVNAIKGERAKIRYILARLEELGE